MPSSVFSGRDSRCCYLTQDVVITSGVVPGASVVRVSARTRASGRGVT